MSTFVHGFVDSLRESEGFNQDERAGKVKLRERQADDIEKAINGIQQRTDLSPQEKTFQIGEARKQLQGLYQPHEGEQLMKRLGKLFGRGKGGVSVPGQPVNDAGGVSVGGETIQKPASGVTLKPGMTLDEVLSQGAQPTPPPAAPASAAPAPDAFQKFSQVYKEATGNDLPPAVAERWALKQGGLKEEVAPKTSGYEPDIKDGIFFGVTGPNKEKYSRKELESGKGPKEALDIYSEYKAGEKEKSAKEDKKFNEQLAKQTSALQIALDRSDYQMAQREINKSKGVFQDAIDRQKTMDDNLNDIAKGNKAGHVNQQAMLSMVANHIGMTLGLQKGARITRAVWDEATASAPWLAKLGAKWSPEGYLSGVTITDEQAQQMVDLAHEKVDIMKDHVKRLQDEYKDDLSVKKPKKGAKKEEGSDPEIDAIVKALNKK